MPRGDKRGPEGAGPMTGRALGYCAGNDQPGFTADAAPQGALAKFSNLVISRSFFAARGRGGAYVPAAADDTEEFNSEESKEREITRLENLANILANELEIAKKQIDELKNK